MRLSRILFAVLALFAVAGPLPAAAPRIYVILWFDTEDYILPASDDAAKRVADWLTAQKIRATFKVVGEKARTLERRGRKDVIESLQKHEIGYHSNWHSVPPSPAQYLNALGWDEGVAEFDRRERPGFDDVARIFGQKPSCYGQPGSSWAPQSFGALRNWGVPVYLDGGSHVSLDGKPHYFGGALTLFKIDHVRTRLGGADDLTLTQERFAAVRERLRGEGGGVISVFYHPCEFVHKQFWDGVNFRGGANPPRAEWKLPPQKSPEETEAAYRNFEDYLRFIQRFDDVTFITASQAATVWRDAAKGRSFTPDDIRKIAAGVGDAVTFQRHGDYALAPSEVLDLLADWLLVRQATPQPWPIALLPTPFGPSEPPPPFPAQITVTKAAFRDATEFVAMYLRKHSRVPGTVWFGSTGVPPEAFLAALAQVILAFDRTGAMPDRIEIAPATLAAATYVADDDPKLWGWVIFPPGFRAPALMDLAKRQAWTLKPALMSP